MLLQYPKVCLNKTKAKVLTCNWLGDNGGMVVRVVARVEIMMVQSSVKPIVQKLDRTRMKENG